MITTVTADPVVAAARPLRAGERGLLAIDESTVTCNARCAAAGSPQTVEARRAYRTTMDTA